MNNTSNNNGNSINKSKETSSLKNDTKLKKPNSQGSQKPNKNTSKQIAKLNQNSSTSSSNSLSAYVNPQTATNSSNKLNAKHNDEEQDILTKTTRQINRSKSESETAKPSAKGQFKHTVAGGFSKDTHAKLNNRQSNKNLNTNVFEKINEITQEKDSTTSNPESITRTVSKTAVVSVQNITNENGMHEAIASQTADFEIELANNYMSRVKKVF